ncbi:MAG: FAD-dependent monooxygenase [Candidatus Hydrothermae bacterium]|nr:FAD-dependent monooxygenase [Candidatus Hydrothermae bacterium]
MVVIGGGIGGLTTAHALHREGIPVRVFETAPHLGNVGKGIWIPPNGLAVMDRLGLLPRVVSRGIELQRVVVEHVQEGILWEIDGGALRKATGNTILSIRRSELHRVLSVTLPERILALGKRGVRVGQCERRGWVVFEDGTRAEGDGVVVADGIHSSTRTALFPEAQVRETGIICFLGISPFVLDDPFTAREIWDGRKRFGFSAVDRTHVYWYAPFRNHGDPPGPPFRSFLLDLYRNFPSPVPQMLDSTPETEILETRLRELSTLRTWTRGRIVLLGDAAHAMTPNLGQGGAQAMEDAFVLAKALSESRSLKEAFHMYEKQRMPRVRRIKRSSRLVGNLAHMESRLLQRLVLRAIRLTPKAVHHRQMLWVFKGAPGRHLQYREDKG